MKQMTRDQIIFALETKPASRLELPNTKTQLAEIANARTKLWRMKNVWKLSQAALRDNVIVWRESV